MKISQAVSEDAPAIARVQVRSWQVAYEDILPASYLATLTTEKREAMWRESISRGSPQFIERAGTTATLCRTLCGNAMVSGTRARTPRAPLYASDRAVAVPEPE